MKTSSDSALRAESSRLPDRRGRACAVVALAVGMGLCLAICTLAGIGLAANGRVGGGPPRFGSGPMQICAGVVTQPRFQAGVGWQSLVMSRTPPAVLYTPYAVCVGTAAWPAALPPRGEWMLPP